MAFNQAELAADFLAALQAAAASPGVPAQATLANALAAAVKKQVVDNAIVVPTLLVAPPGGGPVTGTGQIT